MKTDSLETVESDGAGYHVAKVDNVTPEVFECAMEAVAATRRRAGIDDRLAQIIHNDGRDSFSLSLGNDEAKRAFARTCDELGQEDPERKPVFDKIRELTVDTILAKREEDGLDGT